jgi:hypothetical protein
VPAASGQYLLADYDQELLDAGFDAIPQPRRFRWINFAYNKVASKFPWTWEKTIVSLTMQPGTSYFTTTGATPDLPSFRAVDYVYNTTANHRGKLDHLDNEALFFEQYLALDLAAAANRGTPQFYYLYNQRLYLLAPPSVASTFDIHIHQRINQLVAPGDMPITPEYIDEAILMVVFSEAHKGVHELGLAAQRDADFQEWLDMMKTDDDWDQLESQERTVPDDTWL